MTAPPIGADLTREINYQRHLTYLFNAEARAKEDARRAYAMGLTDLIRKAEVDGAEAITVARLEIEFKKLHARAGRANNSWRKDPEIAECNGYGCTHADSPQHPDTATPTLEEEA
jgi:hypothetical protein